MKYISLIFLSVFICSCHHNDKVKLPTVPLFYYSFNGNLNNKGIEKFDTRGSQYTSYSADGIKDSCFNLSASAYHRTPVIINTFKKIGINNYNGFSVIIWVKQNKNSFGKYAIVGNKSINNNKEKGWLISTTQNGSWQFEISNNIDCQIYKASPYRQAINDNKWHQIAFVVNKAKKEIRLYYNGKNVSILNTISDNLAGSYNIHIGCTPNSSSYSKETFYGKLDEFGLWSKILSAKEINDSYLFFSKKIKWDKTSAVKSKFKLLDWNIWNGGTQYGKEAGLDKITAIIKSTKADFITLQESKNSGAYLADKLDYYYYKRSNNLCILSRYPIDRTFELYNSKNLGVVKINISKKKSLYIGDLWLSNKPNIRGLLMDKLANIDTIVTRENSTHAKETRFILSEMKKLTNNANNKDAFILAGDLNSGSHLDWTDANKDNKNGLVIPFPSTILFEQMGYTDAFRQLFPNEIDIPGITYSPIFTEGYQDRLDYIFYKGSSIEPVKAKVVNTSSSFFPSKRAALLTTFEFQ